MLNVIVVFEPQIRGFAVRERKMGKAYESFDRWNNCAVGEV